MIACNLRAFDATQTPRYTDLMTRLRAAVRSRSELANGYAFRLDSEAITLPEVAEWMSMERLCCPFFSIELSVSGSVTDWLLGLTGPEGVKALIETEFPTL